MDSRYSKNSLMYFLPHRSLLTIVCLPIKALTSRKEIRFWNVCDASAICIFKKKNTLRAASFAIFLKVRIPKHTKETKNSPSETSKAKWQRKTRCGIENCERKTFITRALPGLPPRERRRPTQEISTRPGQPSDVLQGLLESTIFIPYYSRF